MFKSLFILLFLLSSDLFSQTTQDKNLYKKIIASDSIFFIVNTSGCFNEGTQEYNLIKQKGGTRKVIYSVNDQPMAKKISAKQFNAFINKYKVSTAKFGIDKAPTCTLVTEFELTNKKERSTFTNGTCESEFNPEKFLLEILK